MTETSHCRLCAELRPSSDLVAITNDEVTANLNLDFKIFHCFQIQIAIDDKLPKCICSDCCEQVLTTYEFNEKIHRAQEILQNLYDIENKDIKLEWNNDEFNQDADDADEKSSVKKENDDESGNELIDHYGDAQSEEWSDVDDLPLSGRKFTRKKTKRKSRTSTRKRNTDDIPDEKSDISKLELKSKLKKILEEWKNYIWRCTICSYELNSVKDLREHYSTQHNKSPQYACMECTKIYIKYDLFKRHVRAHRNKHKYRCDICGKFSYNKSLHEQHIVRHSKVRKFMCSVCGKSYKTQSSLYIHGRVHLPAEQKSLHECDICHKKFSSAPNLASHKKIHSGIKQYTCEQCGNNFTQKVNLQHHIISKHTDETPCHCNLCPKVFKNIFRLRRHLTIHTDVKPYECNTCGKKYRRGSDLRVHQRIHSGELPYECEYCKKCFRMKKFLQVHIRQHTGERPYSCIECNHHFANSSNYIKHMKAKHGISSFKNLTSANANGPKMLDSHFISSLQKNL